MHNVLNHFYGVESHGSSQYLLKQGERIYDGSTNTSVDSYAYVVLFSTIGYIPNNVEYSWPIVVEPYETIVIVSTCLGSSIKQATTDEQHLCYSKIGALDTFMRKSWTLQFNEEAGDVVIQRKLVKGLYMSNQVDVGLNVFHSCNNHQTSLEWLTLKCTLPKVVRWKPSTIIWLKEIKKAHIDVFKLHTLKDNHPFDFQGQGASLKIFPLL